MAQMHDLRRRIASVKTTGHIAQGMKLVSTAKLKTSQDRVFASRPFARKIAQVMDDLSVISAQMHPYFGRRQLKRQGLLLFTADRGLCGNFNDQLVRLTLDYLQAAEAPVDVVAVGAEGIRELRKAGIEPVSAFLDYTGHPTFAKARFLAQLVTESYTEDRWQRVDLVFSKFHTVLNQKPRKFRLLPIAREDSNRQRKSAGEFIYEPNPAVILDHLAQRYVETEVYRALLETQAGEHGARVTAMEAASNNAKELTEKLTRQYNSARQSAITTELAEIVGGAAGLASGEDRKGVKQG